MDGVYDDVRDDDVRDDDAFTMRNVDEDANVKKYHDDCRRRQFDDARSKQRRRCARHGVDDGTHHGDDAMRAWTRRTTTRRTTRGDDRATRGE